MSRCPDCGMKECCGAAMSELIADLERQLAEANAEIEILNEDIRRYQLDR